MYELNQVEFGHVPTLVIDWLESEWGGIWGGVVPIEPQGGDTTFF
jgi:hypothetical protein